MPRRVVSYTSSDRECAFRIATQLKTLGHLPHHDWEIKDSDDIYGWMEQRHDRADHAICVISDEYLKAILVWSATLRCGRWPRSDRASFSW